MIDEYSFAHIYDMNELGEKHFPDRRVPWLAQEPANLTGGPDEIPHGLHTRCGYCGSMHPADVVAAIWMGARCELADRKYGWPHKVYVAGIPNPHAGMLERAEYKNRLDPGDEGRFVRVHSRYDQLTGEPVYWWARSSPAPMLIQRKFYTVHLRDASPEDKMVIETYIGYAFEFDGPVIRWKRF